MKKNSDFYFKYLYIDYNKKDIDNFLNKWPLTESRFQGMEVSEVKELMPSLFDWFSKHDLVVTQIFLINHKPGFKQDIHVDYEEQEGPKLAINVPLTPMAAASTTRVYEFSSDRLVEINHRDGDKVVYSKVEPEHVEKIGEYKSYCPVLLNITKPHSAWNNTNHLRALLTFRFKTDPDFLIKE
jgi:hypothetical protein